MLERLSDRRSLCLAAALFLLLTAPVWAQTATGPASGSLPQSTDASDIIPGPVVAVRFEGNHELSSDELATVTSVKVTGWFMRTLNHIGLGEPYQTLDLSSLQHDTAVLNQYYADHGFILARSAFRVSPNKTDVKAYNDYIRHERLMKTPGASSDQKAPDVRDTVTYIINEGPPFTIGRVTISGLEALPEEFQPELTEHVTIKSGQRWSRAAAANEMQRLSKILIENGYPNVHSDTIVVTHIEGRTNVNVILYFHAGHRYKYGPVEIVYDTAAIEKSRVSDNVILAQLMIDSGQWFKLSEVQRSEQNLYKLNTFDLVRVSLDTEYINRIPDSMRDGAAVPVQVFLRMKLRGELPTSVYGGTSAQGFVFGASVGYTNRNLTQVADNFSARASWQPLPTTQLRYSANVDYLRPYIGLGRIPMITGVGASEQQQGKVPTDTSIHQYDQRAISAHLGSSIVLSKTDNKTTLTPDLLIEYDSTQTNDSIIRALLPPTQSNLLPTIGYQDDRTNDQVNPTGGDLLSASAEWGIPVNIFARTSSNYVKVSPQIKYYVDLTNYGGAVLATRLRLGASKLLDPGNPLTHPSLNHRFFGGGSSSNRGWAEQSLVVSTDAARTADLGGYNDLEFNLEMRYAPFHYANEFTSMQKMLGALRLVLFYDAGNVWDNVIWTDPNGAIKDIAQTIGLGLRFNTFFGALRADWGLKLYDPTGRFNTDIHAATLDSQGAWLFSRKHALLAVGSTFNWHFGIGQAF